MVKISTKELLKNPNDLKVKNYIDEAIEQGCIYIPGNVPSSKNSRRWTGKISIASKSVFKWKKTSKPYWVKYKKDFLKGLDKLQKPYAIGLYFIKSTAHIFDFNNPTQTIQDTMVYEGWLDDDNIKEMLPIPFSIDGEYFSTSKQHQGVLIKIIKDYSVCL